MANETVTLDPAGTALELGTGGDGFYLRAFSAPPPKRKRVLASSVDTEGSLPIASQYENRIVTVTVRAVPSASRTAWYTKLAKLQQKVGKINREGGVLKRIPIGGTLHYFDLIDSEAQIDWDEVRYALRMDIDVTLAFEARPFCYGAEQTLTAHHETTAPCLIFTENSIKGDVPATGRLVITNDQAAAQRWFTWAVQSRYYSAGNPLLLEAEALTTLNSATAPVDATASNGFAVLSAAVGIAPQAFLSTNAGGTLYNHQGTFRVYARIKLTAANAGTMNLALWWAVGDGLKYTVNPAVVLTGQKGTWLLLDLGLIRNYPGQVQGSSAGWEGRLLAWSTDRPADTVRVDYLMFVPIDEGSGIAEATAQAQLSSAPTAADEFDQTAGALIGKTARIGGAWAGAGDATDFTVDTATHQALRSEVSDANALTGHYAISGAAAMTNTSVQVMTFTVQYGAVIARYTDTSNWLWFIQSAYDGVNIVCKVQKRVAGVLTDLGTANVPSGWLGAYLLLRLEAYDTGFWKASLMNPTLLTPIWTLEGWDADLATGGAIASGKVGFMDANLTTNNVVRAYDNFLAYAPLVDDAIYASTIAEVSSTGVRRAASGNANLMTPEANYQGDFLTVPVAGLENRVLRVLVKACRVNPAQADSAIDDISAQLYYTPRWLMHPDA